jgi:hypothetical protein
MQVAVLGVKPPTRAYAMLRQELESEERQPANSAATGAVKRPEFASAFNTTGPFRSVTGTSLSPISCKLFAERSR